MEQTQKAPPKRNAAQRLDDLENAVSHFFNSFNNLAADTQTIKEAIKLLGNKSDAVVQVIARGLPMNDESVSEVMIENNVKSLKEAVTKLVEDKILAASEDVSSTGFIVGQEVNDEGKVIQPRTQFALAALPPELQVKLLGHKAGDVVELQEGKLKLSIQEIYTIQTPPQPEVPKEA